MNILMNIKERPRKNYLILKNYKIRFFQEIVYLFEVEFKMSLNLRIVFLFFIRLLKKGYNTCRK